jgi:hypothetical protein
MTRSKIDDTAPVNAQLDGLIEATLEIANRDAAIRRRMKAAIERDELAEALRCACALLGMEPTPAVQSLNGAKAV